MEVIVVVLVMTLALSMVMGFNFHQQQSVRLRTAGREAFAFLAASRSQAVLSGQSNTCRYDPVKGAMLSDLRNRTLSLPQGVSVISPEELAQEREKSQNIRLIIVHSRTGDEEDQRLAEDEPYPLVVFYPDGSADGNTVWLTANEKALSITIDPVLGEPKVGTTLVPLSEVPAQ